MNGNSPATSFAILFIVFALSACTREARTPSPMPQPAQDTSTNIVSPPQPDLEALHKSRLDSLTEYFYASYEVPPRALIARFGTPDLAETSRVANKRVEAQSVIYKYGFHGTTVTMNYATGTKRYRLRNVSTSDIRRLSGFGISQSISPDSLRNLFGQETAAHALRSNTLSLRYEIGLATEILSFIFHGNMLDSVSYQPFIE